MSTTFDEWWAATGFDQRPGRDAARFAWDGAVAACSAELARIRETFGTYTQFADTAADAAACEAKGIRDQLGRVCR